MSAGHSSNVRLTVFGRDNWACRSCGFRQTDEERLAAVEALIRTGTTVRFERWLTVDHIVPKSKGGRSCLENLQTLCNRCNGIKGDSCDPVDITPARMKKHWGVRSKLVSGLHRSKGGRMLIHDPRCDGQFCINTCPVYLEKGVVV